MKKICFAMLLTMMAVMGLKAQNLEVTLTGGQIICSGGAEVLTATATGGQPDYSYQWSNGQTTMTVSVSPVVTTTYTVTVTDQLMATAEQSVTVTVNPSPAVYISLTNQLSCVQTATTLSANASGGTPNYTYAWSGGNTNNSIIAISAGTYTVTVTDQNGCSDQANIIVIYSPCDYGDLNDPGPGSGTGNYQTRQNDNGPGHAVNSALRIGANVDGEPSPQPSVAANGDDLNFDDENGVFNPVFIPGLPANVSVAVLNNTAAIAHLSVFSDWNNDGDFFDLSEKALVEVPAGTNGEIIVTVNVPADVPLNTLFGQRVRLSTDAAAQQSFGLAPNGEVEDQLISVTQCFGLIAEPSPSICPGATGGIDLSVSGVTGPYTFMWSNGTTSEDLTNVPSGFYTVTVSDNQACTLTASQTIFSETPWEIDISATETLCEGVTALATVLNGTGTYQYLWSTGAVGPELQMVAAGTYYVTVTDDAGCFKPDTIANNVNVLAATAVANGICYNTQTGVIDISVTGGTAPYVYLWTTSETTQDLTNLGPGQYCVTITDSNGCTLQECFTVTELSPLLVTTSVVNATCGIANGSISLSVSGSAGGYTFNWAHIAGTNNSQNLTGLDAGTYCVTVTDANGCTQSTCTTVTNSGTPLVIAEITPIACFGGYNGAIDLSVTGGTGPYTYVWANGATTQDINNLEVGVYCATVTDINGCTAIDCSFVGEPDPLSIEAETTNISCSGQGNAYIDATILGGVAPYTYLWSNGTTTQDVAQLTPGVYCLSVTDANGCTSATCVTITQPAPLSLEAQVDSSNCGVNNGAINLTLTGGVLPYHFDWADLPGVNDPQDRTALSPGTYCVTVTDNNACTFSACYTVATNGAVGPMLSVASILEPTCFGQATGAADISVLGGMPPYTWQWSNGSTVEDQTGLAAGAYFVTVTDADNCTFFMQVDMGQPDPITAQTTVLPVSCNGGADGAISVALSGGAGGYSIAWDAVPCPVDCQNLPAGTYCATVTDVEGCTFTLCETVTQPLALEATIETCDNFVFALPEGGVAPYTYAWSNGENTSETSFMPGTYALTVTDIEGCTAETEVVVAPNPPPCTTITGRIVYDADGNCLPESADPGVPMQIVRAENASGSQYLGLTNASGQYLIRVLPGEYTVSLPSTTLPQGATVCAPQNIPVSLATSGETADSVDFAVNIPPCPEMTVTMGINVLRRCFNNNFYWITYCNEGQAAAENAYVDLSLDPYLTLITSNLPFEDLGGNIWRFALGTVGVGQCGQFYVRVEVSCDAEIGQAHCVSASIFPHAPCTPNPLWSGAEVDIRSECVGDSLHFILKNVGTGPMSGALDYIVIEDGIMLIGNGNGPGLPAGDSMRVSLPATGATWRMEADQEPYFPGESRPVLSVEGCTTTGTFSTGWIEPYATGVADPWTTTLCSVNTGAYDPNDKRGAPTGYGVQHYVRREDPIEYRIRFQNTGTDTAFAVVVRDTLSEWLDPTTFRLGASSHLCHFEFGGENVLVFDFQGIMLPDSNINPEGSQGFIQFSVEPRDNTPLETDVFNQAAIYFDYNAPIFTNTTQHRIGENFVVVNQWEPAAPAYRITVSPNPIGQAARIVVAGDSPNNADEYRLRVFDVQGRLICEKTAKTPQFEVKRSEIPTGVSFFDILKNGAPLGQGKLLTSE